MTPTGNNTMDTTITTPTDRLNTIAPLTRRETLQWAFGLTTGTVLTACGGNNNTPDTLPDPTMLTSVGGVLNFDISAQYGTGALDIAAADSVYPGKATRTAINLRSFNGKYMAPTLVVKIGDSLRMKLTNNLPANVGGQSSLTYLNYQNSTNLHFHGLHVDPTEFRPGVFGDYMVDHANAGVKPGGTRQHEINIPLDHTNGIYWYHPHLHGATNVQVSSGMFGAILIRDPNDKFITSPDIRERVIHVHKVSVDATGKTDSFYDSVNNPASAFLLNGAYQPTIVMRPGEVQNWHFINTASFYPFNPLLDGHTLQAYARDGNVFNKAFKPFNKDTVTPATTPVNNQQWPGSALYPGGRHSVLVQASNVPGTYYLRSALAPSSENKEEIVARVVVEGDPVGTAMPLAANLPVYPGHAPITDAELASKGGKQRNLMVAIVPKTDPRIPSPIPAGEEWFVPTSDTKAPSFFFDTVFAAGNSTAPSKLAPFQSSLTVTQTVALNAVEEWTISSANSYPHPFHIHVNDSYVIKVNGEAVTPFWADTLPIPPNGSITFRMRFTDFKGAYVWHCHALDHEDMGMMQLVEVVA
jgi:FtsP/CotA-like multicopper oxidase with cupredoxin domain